MVVAGGAEGFEAADFSLDVVGFEVEVHALLVRLGIGGPLEQNADVRVGESEFAVDLAAGLAEWFFLGVECGAPERDAVVRSSTSGRRRGGAPARQSSRMGSLPDRWS